MKMSVKRQRGSVAIELALLFPVLLMFVALPIFYSRCLWHYTVAQKAAQDAARYVATLPKTEMTSPALAIAAAARAVEIAKREIAELAPGSDIIGPVVNCDNTDCGFLSPAGTLPTTVRVHLYFTMSDPWFDIELYSEIAINATVTMNYVGS
jgi:uncharacterized protein (UPF0333 family)